MIYRIAGNLGGGIFVVESFVDNVFVVAACTAVGKVTSGNCYN